MTVGHDAANNRGGLGREVIVDQKEGRLHLLAGEHVEEVRRRARVRAIVVREIHGGR